MSTGQAPKRRGDLTVAVVTPWRDHLELAPDYFQAIEIGKPDQLVVVDDGSEEPLGFAALRIEPGGFCTASNAGLALVETDLVVFLNNDIAPLKEGWLEPIKAAVEPGVMVGRILDRQPHGSVDEIDYPYVDGSCLGMTTEDARRLGGWDERYDLAGPAYFSDNALSLQARMSGMRLRELFPGVRHKGGQTGGGWSATVAVQANRVLWEQEAREAQKELSGGG